MRTKLASLTLMALVALAAPAAAQFFTPFVVVPASANAGGSAGTYWQTDLDVFNPIREDYKHLVEHQAADFRD